MGVIHTNISPDSIFVDTNGHCVIGEFGESVVLPTSKHLRGAKLTIEGETQFSTNLYTAPELLGGSAAYLSLRRKRGLLVLKPDDRHFSHRRKNPFWLEGNILRRGLPDG